MDGIMKYHCVRCKQLCCTVGLVVRPMETVCQECLPKLLREEFERGCRDERHYQQQTRYHRPGHGDMGG